MYLVINVLNILKHFYYKKDDIVHGPVINIYLQFTDNISTNTSATLLSIYNIQVEQLIQPLTFNIL